MKRLGCACVHRQLQNLLPLRLCTVLLLVGESSFGVLVSLLRFANSILFSTGLCDVGEVLDKVYCHHMEISILALRMHGAYNLPWFKLVVYVPSIYRPVSPGNWFN
jgi:hypothetical protein